MPERIQIGLMGLGVVGSGVVKVLREKADLLARQVGCPLEMKRALVRDPLKKRSIVLDRALITTDAASILDDPEIQILIEVMGGEEPAYSYIGKALASGKHVVTANKEVMAKHGAELLALANSRGVGLRYEASVGGGIPLISPLEENLLANHVTAILAIINGTTNYILTRMAQDGLDFQAALREARELGYAEPDPVNDIEGTDAAYKLAILATLAFRTPIRPEAVYCEGISRLTARDFRYARELGYVIKLLAIAKEEEGALEVRVHPTLLSEHLPLAKVDGVFNAVEVRGDLTGEVVFYGRGAGSMPTSSAIIADLIALASKVHQGQRLRPSLTLDLGKPLRPMSDLETRYYLRMSVADRPGVLAQIARIFGEHLISIASVVQKETDERAKTAELVIMTHRAREASVREALEGIDHLEVVSEIGNFIRVEG